MSKRHTFEEILNTDFRWPTEGDKAFVAADDPFDNANIAEDGFTRLVLMTDGYKQAGDLMVEKAADDPINQKSEPHSRGHKFLQHQLVFLKFPPIQVAQFLVGSFRS